MKPAHEPSHGVAQNLLFAAFALGLLLLPWPLGSNRPWAVGGFTLYFALIAAAWLLARITQHLPAPGVPLRLPLLLALLWLGWVASYLVPAACQPVPGSLALATLEVARECRAAVDPDAHAQVLLRTCLYLLIGLLALLLVSSMRRALLLLGMLLAGAALLAVLGTAAALIGTGFDADWIRIGNPGRASGPFVNPNHFAGYLELLLGLGIGVLVGLLKDASTERSWRQWLRDLLSLLLSARAILRLVLVILVVALVTTQSRSGNVAFLLAVLAGCIVGALAMPRPPRKLLLLGASLLLVDLLIVSSWFGFEQLAQRVSASTSAAMEAGQHGESLLVGADAERSLVALTTLELWQQAPLRGHGGGGFRTLFPAMRPAAVSDRLYDHAHNDYAQMLAEFGLIGALFAFTLCAAAVLLCIQAMRLRKRRSIQGLALGCLIALLALAIHSFWDFNLQIPANAGMFTLVLALAWLCRHGFTAPAHSTSRAATRSRSKAGSGTLVVALALVPVQLWASPPLAQTCREAMSQPVRTIPIPEPPEHTPAQIRQLRDASPKDETLRAQAASTALAVSMRALALTASAQSDAAAALEAALREHLADTVWRMGQLTRSRDAQAAAALLLMVRIGMAQSEETTIACSRLLASDATSAVLAYERALCQLHGQPQLALQQLQLAAEQGHVLAQESLGQLCLSARPADPACAMQWLCKASSGGHLGAAAQAAWLLQQHQDPAHSLVQDLYERAARGGDASSANNLGEMYETGVTGSIDLQIAEHWYRQAAGRGLAEARLNLARLWLGSGAQARRPQALTHLRALQGSHPEQVGQLLREFNMQL